MEAREILATLRKGEALTPDDVTWFAAALADGSVSDAQAGAFAMGICRAPLTREARVALALAMRDTGAVLSWDLPGPVVDKHSTGGVGDCVSLTLAPALAACGVYVPMISGRGLGHTGGTLDKLAAIPGYTVNVDQARFAQVTREVGCAIVSASGDLAPADRRLYAVRDVTGTVESLDLITASILSKKLAAGLEALVLDVKVGSGAFMKTMDDARALAHSLVETANGAGCKTSALITEMDQPLITAAGNALEMVEVMETLTVSHVTGPLWTLTAELGGEILASVGIAANAQDGADRISAAIQSGSAAEIFGRMVSELGGPTDFVQNWKDRLPGAPVERVVDGPVGFVSSVDAQAIGMAVVHLGGGRTVQGDRIDPSVGLSDLAGIGEEVGPGRPLARVHARTVVEAERAEAEVRAAYDIGDLSLDPPSLVKERIGL